MTSIIIKANGSSVVATIDGKLTSGMVGIPVIISYDSSWDNLIKTVSFRNGDFVRSRYSVGTSTSVPWEVMRRSGNVLEVGIEGRDADGNIVMPTVWTCVSKIHQGANAAIPAAPNPDGGEIPSVGGASIDDSVIATDKTWSSKKISDEISNVSGGGVPEANYRHIATYEHTADEGVTQIDITKDKDGNAFSCSDFLIYLTLPTSEDISTNYRTQLYIGHKMWADWELYMPQGFSTSNTRRMRLHLYHAFDGYWLTDGVYNDNASQADYFVPNINGTNSGFGNLRSMAATGKTISEWHFYALSAFNKGTKIEIYGK